MSGSERQSKIRELKRVGATLERNFQRSLNAIVITFRGSPNSAQNELIEALKLDPTLRVEPDTVVTTGAGAVPVPAATQTSAPWGLDRIDQTSGLDGTYTDAGTASGVTVYVIDTGITAHDDFASRLSPGINMIADRSEDDATDGNGQGTHVAGTIAGTVHGVAKGAQLVPVRVLDDTGSGSISGVIAGIEWVLGNHTPDTPGIINMSLGGGISESLDDAVEAAVTAGIVVVVAAGNDADDACVHSPARAASAITVGATTTTDARASFSNYGTCLDIFAPGSSIRSTWKDGTTALLSGTSMATPHVAGAAAVLWGAQPSVDGASISNTIMSSAIADVVSDAGTGSPSSLLYIEPPADDGTEPTPPDSDDPANPDVSDPETSDPTDPDMNDPDANDPVADDPTPSDPDPTDPDPDDPTPSDPGSGDEEPLVAVPGPPRLVTATSNDATATISWSSPADNGGSPITRYTVTDDVSGQTCIWLMGPL